MGRSRVRRSALLFGGPILASTVFGANVARADEVCVYSPIVIYEGAVDQQGNLVSASGSFTDPNVWFGKAQKLDNVPCAQGSGPSLAPGPDDSAGIGPLTVTLGPPAVYINSFTVSNMSGRVGGLTVFGGGFGSQSGTITLQFGGLSTAGMLFEGGGLQLNGSASADTEIAFIDGDESLNGHLDATVAGGTLFAADIAQTGAKVRVAAGGDLSGLRVVTQGQLDGGASTLLVDGKLEASEYLTVGDHGQSLLAVRAGGEVTSGDGFIGGFADGDGTVSLSGGKWTLTNELRVGDFGIGDMTVADGSRVDVANTFFVGANAPSKGTLSITTGGVVDAKSKGAATIGGVAASVVIGAQAGSTGTVTISGQGSKLVSEQSTVVGFDGQGEIDVTNGGDLAINGALFRIGRDAGSKGTVALVGDQSHIDFDGLAMEVGLAGDGTFEVRSGAEFDSGAAAVTIGVAEGGNGSAKIGGGKWTVGGDLIIGDAGTGELRVVEGTLDIADGKTITLGRSAGGDGTLAIIGPNAKVTQRALEDIDIGLSGAGTLEIGEGADVTLKSVLLGSAAGGAGRIVISGGTITPSHLTMERLILASSGIGVLEDGVSGVVALTGPTNPADGRIALDLHPLQSTGVAVADIDGGHLRVTRADIRVSAEDGATATLAISGEGLVQMSGESMLGGSTHLDIMATNGGVAVVGVDGPIASLTTDGAIFVNAGGGSTALLGASDRTRIRSQSLYVGLAGGGRPQGGFAALDVSGGAVVTATSVGIDRDGQANIHDGGGLVALDSDTGGSIHLFGDTGGGGAVLVTGAGSRLQASSLDSNGIVLEGASSIVARDSAAVTASSITMLGGSIDLSGRATLSAGESWSIGESGHFADVHIDDAVADGGTVAVGAVGDGGQGGSGALVLSSGATLRAKAMQLGVASDATGHVEIDEGATLLPNALDIGVAGYGEMFLVNGAIDTDGSPIRVGLENGSQESFLSEELGSAVAVSDVTVDHAGAWLMKSGSTALASGTVIVGATSGTSVMLLADKSFLGASTLVIGDGAPGSLRLDDSAFAAKAVVVAGLSAASGSAVTLDNASVANADILGVFGGGSLTLRNGSTLSVTSLIETFTNGAFDVRGGKASVGATGLPTTNGTLRVGPGGTLKGNTIAGNVVNAGGTVSPGHSPGVLTIQGNYTQEAGGTLLISLGPTDYSRLVVSGTATINGGTLAFQPVDGAAFQYGKTYNVLTATGGESGAFTMVTVAQTAGSPFITLAASLNGGTLVITPVHAANSFAPLATTPNQHAVAAALDAAAPVASGTLNTEIGTLSFATADAVKASLDPLSGEAWGDFASLGVDNVRAFGAVLRRAARQTEGAEALPRQQLAVLDTDTGGQGLGHAGPDAGPSVWLTVDGRLDHARGRSGGRDVDAGALAIYGGVDLKVANAWTLGGAIGFSRADFDSGVIGKGHLGSFEAALYGAYAAGQLHVDAAAGYARNSVALRRSLTLAAAAAASGHGVADQAFFSGEAGYDVAFGSGGRATPFVGLDATRYDQGPISETDAAQLGLAIAARATQSVRSTLGLQVARTDTAADGLRLSLSARLGWAHEFANVDRPVSAAFLGALGVPFQVQGAGAARDAAVVGAELDVVSRRGLEVYARLDADLARAAHSEGIMLGARWRW